MLAQTQDEEDKQIHILQIAGNAIVGGMERYVYNLAQQLPSRYFKVTALTPFESSFTASLRELGCEVYITSMDFNPPWKSIQFVTELIHHLNIDLVHGHLGRAHVLAGLSAKLAGIPAVATIHGMEITTQDLGISRTTDTYLTVVCHDAYAQALALGIPAERLTLIPNGVDLKAYTTSRNGAGFRKALHIAPTTPLVGFVGRLAWEKGPDQFIQVAEIIHRQIPQVHFVAVGEGPMEKDLETMIHDAELDEVFHIAGLWNNTWDVYPALDILVQTSRIEGMPFALLEGMACGKPVAAMGVGGVPEIVEVGTTGILSSEGDWEGLGNAVVSILLNPEKLKQMGHAARKRAELNFDLQYSIWMMENLYYRILGRNIPNDLISPPQPNWHLHAYTGVENYEKGKIYDSKGSHL